jgi:hypothetical protein
MLMDCPPIGGRDGIAKPSAENGGWKGIDGGGCSEEYRRELWDRIKLTACADTAELMLNCCWVTPAYSA